MVLSDIAASKVSGAAARVMLIWLSWTTPKARPHSTMATITPTLLVPMVSSITRAAISSRPPTTKLPRRLLLTLWPPMKLPIAPPMPKTIRTTVMKPTLASALFSRYGRTKV